MGQKITGKVQTVLGTVEAETLGMTLVHEHLIEDLTLYFRSPDLESEKKLAWEPVQMRNLSWIKFNPIRNFDNLLLNDETLAAEEAMFYKSAGGNTIVEVTTGMLGRNPEGLVNIARATGLDIVMGTGYYIAAAHPPYIASRTETQITEEIINEITVGVDNTGIRAGIIGEIGCSWPLENDEKKVLRCCVDAQKKTGSAIYLHPGPGDDSILATIQVLVNSGTDLSRVVVGHVDISGFTLDICHKLANMGCYLAYDNFGNEGFFQLPNQTNFVEISDPQRINYIISLIKDGFLKNILISQDTATKVRLVKYGGPGYAHILRDIIPIMRLKGLSTEQINTILIENPKRLLSLSPSKD